MKATTFTLKVGETVRLQKRLWKVASIDHDFTRVTLATSDGAETQQWALSALLAEPSLAGQDAVVTVKVSKFDRLPQHLKDRVLARAAHIYEVETGFRDPRHPAAHEPRPQYDPAVPKAKRRHAKAQELADNPDSRALGVVMSYHDLRRYGPALMKEGIDAVVDGHLVRELSRDGLDANVEEACWVIAEEYRDSSNITMTQRYARIAQYCSSEFDAKANVRVPSYATLRRWHKARFTEAELTGAAKWRSNLDRASRQARSRRFATRPGERVQFDALDLDILLAGTTFEGQVKGTALVGMDEFSRSIPALDVFEGSERDIDFVEVASMCSRPKPMRPNWPDDAPWPFLGLPDTVVVGEYHRAVANLPMMEIETVVLDHGSVFKSNFGLDYLESMGTSVLPARKGKGQDKGSLERAFQAFRTMLLQYMRQHYTGADPSQRGKAVASTQPQLTIAVIKEILLRFVAEVWQDHVLDDARPPHCPEGAGMSPNDLYNFGLAQTGVAWRVPDLATYVEGLPKKYVEIGLHGVKILNLYYDDKVLFNGLRKTPSNLNGKPHQKTKYIVHYQRSDLRSVFWIDPHGVPHEIEWVGCRQETPAFGDIHTAEIERQRRAHRIDAHDGDSMSALVINIMAAYGLDVTAIDPEAKARGKKQAQRRQQLKASRFQHQAEVADQRRTEAGLPSRPVAGTAGKPRKVIPLPKPKPKPKPAAAGTRIDAARGNPSQAVDAAALGAASKSSFALPTPARH